MDWAYCAPRHHLGLVQGQAATQRWPRHVGSILRAAGADQTSQCAHLAPQTTCQLSCAGSVARQTLKACDTCDAPVPPMTDDSERIQTSANGFRIHLSRSDALPDATSSVTRVYLRTYTQHVHPKLWESGSPHDSAKEAMGTFQTQTSPATLAPRSSVQLASCRPGDLARVWPPKPGGDPEAPVAQCSARRPREPQIAQVALPPPRPRCAQRHCRPRWLSGKPGCEEVALSVPARGKHESQENDHRDSNSQSLT